MIRSLCAIAAFALLSACGGSDSTVTLEESRAESAPALPAGHPSTTAERFGIEKNDPHAGQPRGLKARPAFAWTAPKGWTPQPATMMRIANFTVGNDGKAQCYVSVLAGNGGGVGANINLWRQQMGLEPMGSDAEGTVTMEVLGQKATLVELRGTYAGKQGEGQEDAAMFGLICLLSDQAVFVKMTGPASVVAAERANFKAFVGSLKRVEG